jgi:hypothetical protein
MIALLASPTVCVIDEDPLDYGPILAALNSLYVATVHILGDDVDRLPVQPFKRLRLLFVDLHLTTFVGKDAASHTANVVRRVIPPDTAPIVVVIWSKYAQERVPDGNLPVEDQETEAQLFKRTLLEAEPGLAGRLIFVEMAKPQQHDRPEDWIEVLKAEINNVLRQQVAVSVLWSWESLVADAAAGVSDALTSVSAASATGDTTLTEALRVTMQRLARAQGEAELSPANAADHLRMVLGDLLADQLEHMDGAARLEAHSTWLSETPAVVDRALAALFNGLLLTASVPQRSPPFGPGTIYHFHSPHHFRALFDGGVQSLVDLCCTKRDGERLAQWKSSCKPILLEISPVCDVAQDKRVNAHLIAGLVIPGALANIAKTGDSFTKLPVFHLRWPATGFSEQECFLLLCHRYKTTIPAKRFPWWRKPWFRLRELPTASLRNLQAAQASRVGYVSV